MVTFDDLLRQAETWGAELAVLLAFTPEDFTKWAAVLRMDPLVLLVGWLLVKHLAKQHEEALAILRSLRDEVMQLSGRLILPDDAERVRQRRGR